MTELTDEDFKNAIENCPNRIKFDEVYVCRVAIMPCCLTIDDGACVSIRDMIRERSKSNENDKRRSYQNIKG